MNRSILAALVLLFAAESAAAIGEPCRPYDGRVAENAARLRTEVRPVGRPADGSPAAASAPIAQRAEGRDKRLAGEFNP